MPACKIAFVTALTEIFQDPIAHPPAGFDIVIVSNRMSDEEKIMRLTDVEVVLGVFPILSEKVLRAAPNLKFIQLLHAGHEMMDLPLLSALGIQCATSGDVNSPAVAELTLALMLAVNRKLVAASNRLKAGVWTMASPETDPYTHGELFDKTIGLIGLGNIGRHVAQRLRGFQCRLVYHKRNPLDRALEEQLGIEYVSLAKLYRTADVVSLHTPLNENTRHLISRHSLKSMKRTAILINTARGAIVDESALIEALQQGEIAGAGLDVFDPEPPNHENPLLHMSNVVVTPHIGGGTRGTQDRIFAFCWQNIRDQRAGRTPRHLIQ